MTDKELQEIKRNYEDYINFESHCHGGKGNNGDSYHEGHAEFCEWLIDGFSYLIEEIERLRALNRWIPVTEKLPENNKHILLYLKDGEGATAQVVGCLYHSDNKFLKHLSGEYKAFDGDDFSSNFLNKEYVIAWRPLPELLKEDGNNE